MNTKLKQIEHILTKIKSKYNHIWNEKCKTSDVLPNVLPPVERIIVIGDIHGDMNVLLECLEKANVINTKIYNNTKKYNDIKWIGNDTVIVQVGDQIDSCRFDGINNCNEKQHYEPGQAYDMIDEANDIEILLFMTKLHKLAQKDGGAVYSLLGNHELMNAQGNMSYVSYNNIQILNNYKTTDGSIIKDGFEARKKLFSPGNDIANFLACTRSVVLVIGSNLFVHAGVLQYITTKYKDIKDINILFRLFLLDEIQKPQVFKDLFGSNETSPLWTRVFGMTNSFTTREKCDELMNPLYEQYKIGKIFVGHTPQLTTGIISTCQDRIWLTDAGMPIAFNKFDQVHKMSNGLEKSQARQAQVLEILNDNTIRVIN